MKHWKAIPILCLALVMTACLHKSGQGPSTSLDQLARDTSAGLNGTLTAAQSQHEAECKVDQELQACTLITRGIAGQNALVTATQAYCGWSATTAPTDPQAKCQPVENAGDALKAAITNAEQLTAELSKVVKP